MQTCKGCAYTTTTVFEECPHCGDPFEVKKKFVEARTQKGKGIAALSTLIPSNSLKLIRIIQSEEDIWDISYPVFARPAPSQPRHGYIDSRVVKSDKELKKLLKVVLADDPMGEILLCPFYEARFSAIWTPSSIVIGEGHNGATAGIGAFAVPLSPVYKIDQSFLKNAGINNDSWPYLEVIFPKSNQKNPLYVQLRGGPKITTVGNYIPKPVLVEKVLHADPKLFQDTGWEKEILENEGKPGIVVWHPNGTMTDHFSIHAFASKIPILFDKEPPKVGALLEPTTEEKAFNPQSMLEGFIAADQIKFDLSEKSESAPYIAAAFTALHNASEMTGPNSRWIGAAACTLIKFGCAALMGEARHINIKNVNKNGKPDREAVYKLAAKKNINFHRTKINQLVNIFRYGSWGGAFGGMKWACCGAATLNLFNAVHELSSNPTEKSAADVVKALNIFVNQAHNGGWWLNKFTDQTTFNLVQQGYFHYIVAGVPAFHAWENVIRELSKSTIDNEISRIKAWGHADLCPPRAQSARITIIDAVNSLEVSVSSQLLKDKFKPLKGILPALPEDIPLKDIKQNLYLVEGVDGYRLEYRKNDPIVLWQDKSLREETLKAAKKTQVY